MRRPALRDDVACALSEARGARQATVLLQTQLRSLAEDIEALKTASLSISAIRAALTDHLVGAHFGNRSRSHWRHRSR